MLLLPAILLQYSHTMLPLSEHELSTGLVIVSCKVSEVVLSPELSVALAVTAYVPAAILLQSKEYGLVNASPNFVVPAKNSTFAIVPS